MSKLHFIEVSEVHKNCFENNWSVSSLSSLMKNKTYKGFIATSKVSASIKKQNNSKYIEVDKCVGFALFSTVHEYSELLSLGILKNWRCHGIGSGLMQHVITFIQRSGARRLVLEVAENNISARQLYLNLGFIETSRRIGYYKQSFGNIDALILG